MKLQFIRVAGVFAASAAMTFVATAATAESKSMYQRWNDLDCETVLEEAVPEGKERKLERCQKLEERIPTVEARLATHVARLPKLQARLDKAIEEGKSEEKQQKVRDLIADIERRIDKLNVLLGETAY